MMRTKRHRTCFHRVYDPVGKTGVKYLNTRVEYLDTKLRCKNHFEEELLRDCLICNKEN